MTIRLIDATIFILGLGIWLAGTCMNRPGVQLIGGSLMLVSFCIVLTLHIDRSREDER